jgi:hypothetical protein
MPRLGMGSPLQQRASLYAAYQLFRGDLLNFQRPPRVIVAASRYLAYASFSLE